MNTMTLHTRDAHALEHRDAAARPSSWNGESRTITAIVATGTPVRRVDARGQAYDEVLAVTAEAIDLDAFAGAHVLNGHRQDGVESVIGSIARAWIEGGQLLAEVRFSSRPEIEGIVNDIAQGIIRGVSVGYEVETWADGEASGRRTRTATRWRPRELSFVAVGADPHARTRQHDDTGRGSVNRAIRELGRRCGVSPASVDDLIDREATIEQARAAMLDHMTTRSALSIRTGEHRSTLDNPVGFQRAAGEALFARVHRSHTLSGPARQFADLPMSAIAAECLRRVGESATLLTPATLITRALNTTSDFPLLLGDAVGRVLMAAYKAAPSGLRRIASQTTAPDFRERAALMLDPTSFKLEKVNEHGEYKSGSFTESGEKWKLATFGKIFGLTRQAIINDDLGALADIPAKLGAQAAAFESDYLAALLQSGAGLGPVFADGLPLFDAAHGNLAGPAGAAPDDTTLGAARLAMRKQVGASGELIDIVPRYLVVPPELETAAEKLLTSITAISVDEVNPWSFLTLIVEPRLTDPTRWYLVADGPASGLLVAYLSGAEGPQVETQAGWRIDGVETKVRLDFMATFVDWHGVYMNPGAAGGE